MDEFPAAYYEVIFERDYLKKPGTEFQAFFSEIMEKRYPGDFQRVRPWGRSGDEKNDGYLQSKRVLFQVYAPRGMQEYRLLRKIGDDFREALPHWEQYFDIWTFVHNDRDGLSPAVLKTCLDLEKQHPPIRIERWGFEELRHETFQLCEQDLASLLGPAPTQRDILQVGIEELKVVVLTVAQQGCASDPDIRPVPTNKRELNKLSDEVEILLVAGMKMEPRVKKLFDGWPDPEFGDKIVQVLAKRYLALKQAGLRPDLVFGELLSFVGGDNKEIRYKTAALGILAYFFARCDVFENSPEAV